jgi:hypothetical protein
LVRATEVVEGEEETEGGGMIIDLLGETVGQAGEAAKRHPNGEDGAPDGAGGHLVRVGASGDHLTAATKAFGRRVALLVLRSCAIDVDQLSVVKAPVEGICNGAEVHLVAIGGELSLALEASRDMLQELRG